MASIGFLLLFDRFERPEKLLLTSREDFSKVFPLPVTLWDPSSTSYITFLPTSILSVPNYAVRNRR